VSPAQPRSRQQAEQGDEQRQFTKGAMKQEHRPLGNQVGLERKGADVIHKKAEGLFYGSK